MIAQEALALGLVTVTGAETGTKLIGLRTVLSLPVGDLLPYVSTIVLSTLLGSSGT